MVREISRHWEKSDNYVLEIVLLKKECELKFVMQENCEGQNRLAFVSSGSVPPAVIFPNTVHSFRCERFVLNCFSCY